MVVVAGVLAGVVAGGLAGVVARVVAGVLSRGVSRLWRGLRCTSSCFCVGGTVGAGMGAFLTASFKNNESILVSGSFM